MQQQPAHSQQHIMAPHATTSPSSAAAAAATTTTTASASTSNTLPKGIYVPLVTFFHDDAEESLDLETYYKHVQYVVRAGCAGVVALGSTGERVSLSEEERASVISTARRALDDLGPAAANVPLLAGAGDQSVQTALASLKRAHAAGASHALVLPSSYYPAQLGGKRGLLGFYSALAAQTPIPLLIYSYPGVSAGIVIDSETVEELAGLDNIVGVKHTDHDIGKMARHCSFVASSSSSTTSSPFIVLGGASDYLLGALAVGAQGTITGMGNIAPRSVCRIQRLWQDGKQDEARALQFILSKAEWELGKGGVPIHKALMDEYRGYGGRPRAPLPPSEESAVHQARLGFARLMDVERKLESI